MGKSTTVKSEIRVLFDRRELLKQADRVFKEFMPGEPRVVVDSRTSRDRDKRIYLATYPAMMQCHEDFDDRLARAVTEHHHLVQPELGRLFELASDPVA